MRLREIQSLTSTSPPVRVAEFIRENCAPWLAATKHVEHGQMVFLHGSSYKGAVSIVTVQQERGPRDTEKWRHNAFNAMIKAVGGVANRSNSVFVTGDPSIARNYGKTIYVYFPIGEFHYTWAWKDWTADMESEDLVSLLKQEKIDDLTTSDGLRWDQLPILENPSNYDVKKLEEHIAVDEGLHWAYLEDSEVMVKSDYGLLVDQGLWGEVKEYLFSLQWAG